MKFGLLYLPTYVAELDGPVGRFYDTMLEQVTFADTLGYEAAWLTEHHFHRYGATVPNPAVLGAVVAKQTRRIRIGTAVTVLPLHNPLLVAEDFAMLDVLSNGRLDFGIGRGSVAAEFREFGVAADDAVEITSEQAEVIRAAWSHERFSYHGKHYQYDNVSLLPRPVQQPHPPFWYGAARTPSSFEWAGRMGMHLMVLPYMNPPEFLQERLALYREGLRAAGYDPADFEIMAKFHVFVADSQQEASRLAGQPYATYQQIAAERSGKEHTAYHRVNSEWDDQVRDFKIIGGSPDDCAERITYWQEQLGITQIGGTFHFGGMAQDVAMRSIERFAREVAPRFQGQGIARPTERTPAAIS